MGSLDEIADFSLIHYIEVGWRKKDFIVDNAIGKLENEGGETDANSFKRITNPSDV